MVLFTKTNVKLEWHREETGNNFTSKTQVIVIMIILSLFHWSMFKMFFTFIYNNINDRSFSNWKMLRQIRPNTANKSIEACFKRLKKLWWSTINASQTHPCKYHLLIYQLIGSVFMAIRNVITLRVQSLIGIFKQLYFSIILSHRINIEKCFIQLSMTKRLWGPCYMKNTKVVCSKIISFFPLFATTKETCGTQVWDRLECKRMQ